MNNKTICNPVGIVSSAASYLKLYDERFSHLKELGYDTLDVSLSNMDSDFYKSSTEMEKYCTEIRYAAEISRTRHRTVPLRRSQRRYAACVGNPVGDKLL